MIKFQIDEDHGSVFDEEGNYLFEVSELAKKLTGVNPEQNQSYTPPDSSSEILLKRSTEFELPEPKKGIEDTLWHLFRCGIHLTMSNLSSPAQTKRARELSHSAILTSMLDPKIAAEMSVSDYIQLHAYAEQLIRRSVTYEGDRLRDATIYGRNLDAGAIDALKFNPDSPKNGGFLGVLKNRVR